MVSALTSDTEFMSSVEHRRYVTLNHFFSLDAFNKYAFLPVFLLCFELARGNFCLEEHILNCGL